MQDLDSSHLKDSVDQLIYRMSHDFRGPIRALLDLPGWIEEDLNEAGIQTPEKVTKTLSLMEMQADRLNKMLHGLLIHSRIGRSENVELEAAQFLKQKSGHLELPATTRLRMRLEPALLDISVADLERALTVLVDNALIHGMPADDRNMTARIAVVGRNLGDEWVLAVRDNGPGIPPQHHAKVFEPMTVLHGASENKGVGMGLAILSKIATTYGGRAYVQPQRAADRGTTICLRLPLVQGPGAATVPNSTGTIRPAGTCNG